MTANKTTLAIRAEQTINPDGSITIRAVELTDDRDIRTAEAAKRLGLSRETIYMLCEMREESGGLNAWKLPTVRGNSPWRISLASVLSFRERNSHAAR